MPGPFVTQLEGASSALKPEISSAVEVEKSIHQHRCCNYRKNHGPHGEYRNRNHHLLHCEEVALWYSRAQTLILVLRRFCAMV